MSQNYDMFDLFSEYETVTFNVSMKGRDGLALPDPAGTSVSMIVCSDEARDAEVFQITGSPEAILSDTPTATWQFKLSDSNRNLLTPGTIYYYDIWSNDPLNGWLHQVDGALRLRAAGNPV